MNSNQIDFIFYHCWMLYYYNHISVLAMDSNYILNMKKNLLWLLEKNFKSKDIRHSELINIQR